MATIASESSTATTQTVAPSSGTHVVAKDRRPFLTLEPVAIPDELPPEVVSGLTILNELVENDVQLVTRAIVGYTVANQIREQRAIGRTQGVPISVLNRRRRAARAWIVAILQGNVDAPNLRVVTSNWIPQLTGTGPDVTDAVCAGETLIEYVRGVISGSVMTDPADNLVPHAHALHALDTILGIHLQALREAARTA